jgi:hypothetical protein
VRGSRFSGYVPGSCLDALRDIAFISTGLFARRGDASNRACCVAITPGTAGAFGFNRTPQKWSFSAGFRRVAPSPVGIFESGKDRRVGHLFGHTLALEWRKSVQPSPSSKRGKKSDINYRSVRHLGSSWFATLRGRHVAFGCLLTSAPRLYKRSGAAEQPLLLLTSTSEHVWTW